MTIKPPNTSETLTNSLPKWQAAARLADTMKLAYLQHGWLEETSELRLKEQIVDGAIDMAGTLLRHGVPPELLNQTILRLREFELETLSQQPSFETDVHESTDFLQHLQQKILTPLANEIVLHTFLRHCLATIASRRDTVALQLHLKDIYHGMLLYAAIQERQRHAVTDTNRSLVDHVSPEDVGCSKA